MNADGFGQTRLTDQPSPNFNPSWSADGKKIAYQSQRTGNFEIYREGHGWRQPDEPY
jgi:Tol biopolymer transport system component